jgi:cell division protein FtsA
MRGVYYTGIDIGSTNIYIAVGRKNEKKNQEIIGACCSPSFGIKEGMVVSIENTITSISRAIREAETVSDTQIKAVTVGIKGQHIESYNHESAIMISRTDKEICDEDVKRVMDNARVVRIPTEKEIIHIIPQGYTVDAQRGVENPVGMEGTHLIAKVQLVFGMSNAINNVVKCINRSGLGCSRTILGILAASDIVVTREEKDLGCILIDIGGQTINLAIFSDGYLQFIKQLPIGGDMITRDIARVCRVLPSEAKRIKESFGNADAKMVLEDQVITTIGIDNISQVKVSEKNLADIIEARIREILGYIKDEIRNTNYENLVSSGAILIGGCSMLNGIKDLTENILGMPVHIGIPHSVTGVNAVTESPLYATALGLVKYADEDIETLIKEKASKGFLSKLKSMLDRVF